MASKIHNGILILTLILFASCRTQKPAPRPAPPETVDFPTANIPLPVVDFNFMLPEAPELAVCHSPRKDITEAFTPRDKSQIAIKDPKLFDENNTEIIDLSLIPAGEYAFPLPNGNVISPYGGRRRHHSGVDIKTCANDTIVSLSMVLSGWRNHSPPMATLSLSAIIMDWKRSIATTPRTWLNPEIAFSPDNRSP